MSFDNLSLENLENAKNLLIATGSLQGAVASHIIYNKLLKDPRIADTGKSYVCGTFNVVPCSHLKEEEFYVLAPGLEPAYIVGFIETCVAYGINWREILKLDNK